MDIAIDISLPRGWRELSQEQLRFLLETIVCVESLNRDVSFSSREEYADYTAAQVSMICFLRWSGLRMVCPYADGFLFEHGSREVFVRSAVINDAASRLSWTAGIPEFPVRLDIVDGAQAVPADLSSGFSFDSWLACETLWQRHQATQDGELLGRMAAILYGKEDLKPDSAESLGVFFWWSAVKEMVASMFPHFFRRVGGDASPSAPPYDEQRRNIDTQIRALTKGDVTKENQILSLEAVRALTELDAVAREYEELREKYPST